MLVLYAGIFVLSAAMLLFEITLTRLFSVMQWYHFAFISVSVALLGLGASGTWLALRPVSTRNMHLEKELSSRAALLNRLAIIAALFSFSILIAYLAINHVPFDSYRLSMDRRQLLYLALYYPALILPFFFAGLCIGRSLATWPERANRVYAANLAGSATGSLAVLVLVPALEGTGAAIGASVMGMLAALIFSLGSAAVRNWYSVPRQRGKTRPHVPARRRRQARPQSLASLIYASLLAVLLILLACPPKPFELRISPYKTLSISLLFPQSRLTFSSWNAFSRVDVLESSSVHSAPGLSLSFTGRLPKQWGLLVDGANLSPITCLREPGDELFLRYLPAALPFLLRPGARVLLIEPRGGLDVLVALEHGVSSVLAVESNPLIVQATESQLQDGQCRASIYKDPRVQVALEEGRSYIQRSTEHFDLVILSLSDTYQPVVSGAYSLSESYAYTVEAFGEYLRHLAEDGILVVTRWMQSPPSEEVRACALLAEALERDGAGDPAARVVAFRSWSTATLLAKRTPFHQEEIAGVRDFCAERSFDLIYYPGMLPTEANRYNLLPDTAHHDSFRQVLSGTERSAFLQQYPYQVSPPSDDRPFFFHYFKWTQVPAILRMLGKTWQPFGGSGFLVLVALLMLATVLSLLLILLPLAVRGSPAASGTRSSRDLRSLTGFGSLGSPARPLLYFACLGLGFLFVEMPLLQQFILFLGQPTYSFSLVLFSILFFSGLGSLLSAQIPVRTWLLLLILTVLAYPLLLPRLFAWSLSWSLPLRLAVTVCCLSPLGFLLGTPLPGGIRLLERHAPQLIPWAWAVNGCASVISSILAVIGAVTFGFSRVLTAGAATYFLAWMVAASLHRQLGTGSSA